MVRITVSSPLRRFCNQEDVLDGCGETVIQVILDATRKYPELRRKVLKSKTEIHSQILVYRNGNMIPRPRETVTIGADTELNLLLIVGGG